MSYEEREGYGVTRPRTIKTPDGTWNYYPKKGKSQPPAGPPVEEQQAEQGSGGYDPYSEYGGSGYGGQRGYDPYSEYAGSGGAYEDSTGGIMTDVDIAGFGEAFNIFGGGGRRKRR